MFARRRPLLRAAVVGGGAYAAGRHMGRQAEQRNYAEAEQDQRIGDVEQQQQYAPPSSSSSNTRRRPSRRRRDRRCTTSSSSSARCTIRAR